MLRLSVEELEAGMTIAAPVLHPENPETELLRKGYVLEKAVVSRLRKMGIGSVYVEYPGLEELDKHLAPYLSPARTECLQHIKAAITAVQGQAAPSIPYNKYKDSTKELVSSLLSQGQNAIFVEQMNAGGSNEVLHGATVAHLALMLGMRLDAYLIQERPRLDAAAAKDPVNLGIAGMLHDVGLTKLPMSMRCFSDPDRPDSEDSLKIWLSHTEIGYQAVRNSVDATVAATILNHHRHFDGSGFPNDKDGPVSGSRIHIFCRILAAANLFDRLANPPRGQKRSNVEVLRLLRGKFSGWLDPRVLKALCEIVPPFPPGNRVPLSDGTWAVVMDVDPGNSMRPLVRRIDPETKLPSGEQLDLRIDGTPQIVVEGGPLDTPTTPAGGTATAPASGAAVTTAVTSPASSETIRKRGYQVMISYSSRDKNTAAMICLTLEKAGIKCWIAPRDIIPGVPWGEAIVTAIECCPLTVLVVSEAASASPQVVREMERAVAMGRGIIPFRIDSAPLSKNLQYYLGTCHWFNALGGRLEEFIAQLVPVVKRSLSGAASPGTAPQAGPQPAAAAST